MQNALTNEQKIDLLNTLKVDEWGSGGGELEYVHVADTLENRAVLAQIVDGDLDKKFEA